MCESISCDESEFDCELVASEEIMYLDQAIEKSKKIQSSLEASINQIEKLKSKYEGSANNYFYDFVPSKKVSRDCARTEYLLYSIYDIHLTKLCQKLDLYSSPQRCTPPQFKRLTHVSSSCSSSPSTSSTEYLQTEDETMIDENVEEKKTTGYRSHREILKIYNKMKTEKIKSDRELSGALISLDKAMTLSTNRANEAKSYVWLKPKLKTPKRNISLNYRRSISTSMCRVKHSTPIQIKRPLSTSVIF
ncbi:hypothetical protein PVAND_006395 [Polypedilum vanderplanki]|uniref:Uncharacterized protein n=1 Tax=Polypedilum vanderplanki TaxID=319348 RepID=A0A9J6C318_POLVA|nr:hypothetical protein PVAND_006395 [Polypedilum vanderplanki]